MAQKFLSDIHPTAGLKDSSGDLGSDGQVLSSTGAGTNWIQAGSGATVIHDDQFTATANQTVFTLSNTVDAENKTQVYIDGAYQAKAGYTVSGTTLTFDTGLAEYSEVEVITFATAIASNAAAVIRLDEFTGNNSTTDFALAQGVTDEKVTQVYINGVYQHKDTYSITDVTLAFSTAPPTSADIEVITFDTLSSSGEIQASSTALYVKNTSGSTIDKGIPVYITGSVGNSNTLTISPANASNASHMPSTGLLLTTLTNNSFGYIITNGFLKGLTTNTIDGTSTSSNDTIYVKAGGGLTMTKPTGTNLIQNIGKVARSSGGNSGSILVSSILRSNDVPNIASGKIWVGDSNAVATERSLSGDATLSNTGALTLGTVPITKGGTGATSASAAKTALSLDNLDNTSDANKPVSTAGQAALDLKSNIAGPTFTGVPAAPTASAGTNTTQLATTAFVTTGIANIVDSSPGALNTLNELAAALGDDANFSTTVTNSIATKAPLASPTFTGNATFSGKSDITTSVSGFASTITNNKDDSQGLLVRTSDNDGSEYILDLQSSSSATGTNYASKFNVAKSGNATLNAYLKLGTSASQTILGDFGETNTYLINYNSGGTLRFLIGGGASSNEKLTISSGGETTITAINNSDTLTVKNTGTYGGTIAFTQGASTNIGYIGSIRAFEGNGSADNGVGLFSRDRISFYTDSSTPDVTIASGGNVTLASGLSLFTQGPGRVYTHNVTLREQDNTAKFQIYSSGGGCVFYNAESNGAYYFYTNGTERMRISSGGDVGIGVDSNADYRLNLRGKDSTGSKYILVTTNSNGYGVLHARNDGAIYAGLIASDSGTDLVLNSSGFIHKKSSSIRYKKDVEKIDIGLDFILSLNPKKYNLKSNNQKQVGFIAEDFPDDRLVSYSRIDTENESKGLQKEAVNYAQLTAPLVKAIQEQQNIIEDLKSRIETLEG